MQVLDNVRVVEWTEAMAGPYCAMMLGDLGANVIKIERPQKGDMARGWGPPFIGSESAYFLSANRNKRSITLNLNNPHAVEILRQLVARADVFIHNQPQLESLIKRGLDYDTASRSNPRLVYCAISGYGATGPKAGMPGYDMLAQGEAGLMSLTGPAEGEPMRYPIPIADMTCGVYSAMGILAALMARERTGKGQFLDMSLVDSQLTWLGNVGSSYLNAGEAPQRYGNAHPTVVPYEVFRGSDGAYFILGSAAETQWQKLCKLLGVEETIGKDHRFALNRTRVENRGKLIALLQDLFRTKPASEWIERIRAAGIPAGPVNTVQGALTDEHILARGAVVEIEHPSVGSARSIANPIKMSATPPEYRLPPPQLGEHTTAVLHELGLSNKEVDRLKAEDAL